jgi:hypothetical protein
MCIRGRFISTYASRILCHPELISSTAFDPVALEDKRAVRLTPIVDVHLAQ